MTAICAIRTDTNVVMGADSVGVSTGGYSLVRRRDKKLFRVGPFLIGYTTSWRMGQLLQYGAEDLCNRLHDDSQQRFEFMEFSRLTPTEPSMRFMVREFVPRVREAMKRGGFSKVKDNEETGGDFVVAYGAHLFRIFADFSVEEPEDNYAVCGSGHDILRGSLYSSQGDPHQRICLALAAAEHHSGLVRRPFILMETDQVVLDDRARGEGQDSQTEHNLEAG